MGVASGNLWLVRLATYILQPMEHTNHKFPTATATGVPCEVKSTVYKTGEGLLMFDGNQLHILVAKDMESSWER